LRETMHWESVGARPSSQMDSVGQTTAVRCTLLEHKAREYGITDLVPFYRSAAFRSSHFSYDAARGFIIHTS
jgi:DNA replication licensing factor MCM2